MIGFPHVSFRGLGHCPCQLVDSVEDVVAGALCEVRHGPSDRLVASLFLFVQQLLHRLVKDRLGPTPGVYAGLQPSLPKRCTTSSAQSFWLMVMVPFSRSRVTFMPRILDTLPLSDISALSISCFFSLLSSVLLALRNIMSHTQSIRKTKPVSSSQMYTHESALNGRKPMMASSTYIVPNQFFRLYRRPYTLFLSFMTRKTPAMSLVSELDAILTNKAYSTSALRNAIYTSSMCTS